MSILAKALGIERMTKSSLIQTAYDPDEGDFVLVDNSRKKQRPLYRLTDVWREDRNTAVRVARSAGASISSSIVR